MLAFRLYCEIPFGQKHRTNPSVVRLASLIERTPSAVAMKLGNFAHLDPAMAQRGITGMSNVSQQDREIAVAFGEDWDGSVESTRTASIDAPVSDEELPRDVPTEALARARVRLTQGFFRRAVLSAYDQSCCACGVDVPSLLTASHIKPWAADATARTNPSNGLALCALHDRAFDRGLITVLPSLLMAVSPRLETAADLPLLRVGFRDLAGQPVRLPSRFAPDATYLAYHNEHVFKAIAA